MKTYDLHEAAQILHLHPDTVQRRAKAGEIPGAKPGKEWVFREEALAEYLLRLETQPRQAAKKELIKCSTNVVTLGGLTLQRPTGSGLDARLAPVTSRKHRNFTTGSKPKRGGKSS